MCIDFTDKRNFVSLDVSVIFQVLYQYRTVSVS